MGYAVCDCPHRAWNRLSKSRASSHPPGIAIACNLSCRTKQSKGLKHTYLIKEKPYENLSWIYLHMFPFSWSFLPASCFQPVEWKGGEELPWIIRTCPETATKAAFLWKLIGHSWCGGTRARIGSWTHYSVALPISFTPLYLPPSYSSSLHY